MLDIYFSYWKVYVKPIEEEKRRVQFNDILIDVGLGSTGWNLPLNLPFSYSRNKIRS